MATLYEYYTSKGLPMPSLTERAKTFESLGLGSAASYGGTASQNSLLLGKLSASAPFQGPLVDPRTGAFAPISTPYIPGVTATAPKPAPFQGPAINPKTGAFSPSTPYIPGVTARAPFQGPMIDPRTGAYRPASPTNPVPMVQYTAPIGPSREGPPLPSASRPGIPTTKELTGIGTLTTVPKTSMSSLGTPTATQTEEEKAALDAGMYQRTGVAQPATSSAGAPVSSGVFSTPTSTRTGTAVTVPQYGAQGTPITSRASITEAYNTLSASIDEIEKTLKDATLKSEDEKRLEQDLLAKKAALGQFDVETLQRLEDYQGQGRGATLRNVGMRQDQERRTRALERLGLAQEAQTISDQLGLAQENRSLLSTAAQNALSLAGKRLDVALGLQGKLDKLDEDERDNARQFLLDIVSFGEGKTFDELDAETQQQISNAVANSPITLGMVKTALAKGAESKNEFDELLSPAEAKSYNVPYGTTKGQIAGKTAPSEGGGPENPGEYSPQELRILRAHGLNPQDIEGADRYLYGDGARRGVLTIPQLEGITQSLFEEFLRVKDIPVADRDLENEKNPDPDWETLEDLKTFITNNSVLDVNDQKIVMSDLQKNVILQGLDRMAYENMGFFQKWFGQGHGL